VGAPLLQMRKAKKAKREWHIESDRERCRQLEYQATTRLWNFCSSWDGSILRGYLILDLVIFLLRDNAAADQFGGAAVRSAIDDALCSFGTHSWQI